MQYRKYRVCEHCGDHLDFGEKCNCQDKKEKEKRYFEEVLQVDADGQLKFGGLKVEQYNKN